MANEVTILIKAKNDAKAVIADVRKDLKGLSRDAGGTAKAITKMGDASQEASRKQSGLGGTAKEVTKEVGKQADKVDDLGRKLRRVSTGTYNVKVDIDKDGRVGGALGKIGGKLDGFAKSVGDKFEDVGTKLVGVLPGAIGGAFTAAGPIIQTAMVVIGAIIVAALSAFIAAGLAAGILAALGGGVLAAGIFSALKSDKIDELLNGKKVTTRSALNKKGDKTPNFGADVESREGGLVPKVKDIFTKFGEPFVDPLVRALDAVDKALDRIGPKAEELSNKFAPVVDQLAPALMQMAENAWPGIEAAINASLPLFQTLADMLPSIGAAISLFFQTIADHGPAANQAFGQIIGLVGTLIVALASVFEHLLRVYERFMQLKNFLNESGSTKWLMAPINALMHLIDLLDDAIGKQDRVAGFGVGQARTLAGNSAPGQAGLSSKPGRATGGIAGGMTRVAERGGELIKLPQGSMVYASGQSQQMVSRAQGGGGGKLQVELLIRGSGGGSAMAEWFMGAQRSGDVQVLATSIV